MTTVTYERPVHYYETDRMGCVHHSNYIRWFEEARVHFMHQCDFSYEGLEAAGIVSPVLRVEADYKTMTRFGDTVCIDAAIESYSRSRIVFVYTVRDRDTGVVRCTGRTFHCFLNAGGRPVSLKKACPSYDEAIRRVVGEELPQAES